MNSQSFPPRSRLRTDTAQSKIQGPVNNVCRGRHEGLDVGTKNSDFPVEGELFPLTSPFIERTERHCGYLLTRNGTHGRHTKTPVHIDDQKEISCLHRPSDPPSQKRRHVSSRWPKPPRGQPNRSFASTTPKASVPRPSLSWRLSRKRKTARNIAKRWQMSLWN